MKVSSSWPRLWRAVGRSDRCKAGEKAGAGAAPAAGGARGLGTHAGARLAPLRPPLAVGGFAPGGGPWPAPDSSRPSALRFWLINGAVLGRAARTAWHAGLVGRRFLEAATRIPVEVDLASEFRYRDPIVDEDTLFVAVSQSGETADTLAALRDEAKQTSSEARGDTPWHSDF